MVVSFDSLESGDSRRAMETLLVANGADGWLVPLWPDASPLTNPWVTGSPSAILDVDTTLRRFAVGRKVLLLGDDYRTFDVAQVQALTDSTIELDEGPVSNWPGGALVVPLVRARFESMPALNRFTGDDAPVRVAMHTDEPVDWDEDPGAAQYRGLPVIEYRPSGAGDPSFSPERELHRVDAGSGPVTVFDTVGVSLPNWTAPYVLIGLPDIAGFRSLLYALAGRWGVAWVPTFANDLRVTGALTNASTLLDVAWTGISEWPLQANRRDIRIELRDGTVLYRRITAAAAIGAGERLTLDSAHGIDASAAEVLQVSFLMLARQDADVNVLRYWRHDVVETELRFKGVLDDGI